MLRYNALNRTGFYTETLKTLKPSCVAQRRNHLETVVAQLTLPSSNENAVMEMFIQLPQHVDAEMLSPWQQREFRHIFGALVVKK